ncbi:hypothetical protein BCR41DRAFT_15223 [Lobosporangium transversale]|uniref:Phospholipid/glycerol acyltransferase domain-containing protein n=1 Tax=Lobosporangium transversale TaxID=64571 RepID=A0A1Y2GTH9_9FUNG|nr:hypothetical protein BCR41DRAFT_15223 [Lobosporangium transversale]ORZ22801.1 hypothetical protein BCR41DRAFT_15223 [Lobosporangium transversale]|eukprot:XP_021883355.1 hypothetical protein BCR41DRAFT_15223 [Lobosporangium transversale]
MEKFSRWRDQGTGIQPFLPPVPANADHSPIEKTLTVILMIVKPITGVVKLALVSVVVLAFVLFQMAGLALSPLGFLYRLYSRLIMAIFARFILGLLGFFWIKHEVVTIRRGRSSSTSKNQISAKKSTSSGNLIVCNWSSYIDVLYLAFRYNPVFTQIYLQTLTVREVTFWEALRLSGSYPELSPPEGVETWPLLDFVKAMHSKGAGPVVVFPEGTTTNNRAILKFVPIFKSCSVPETSIDITVMALKYDYYKFAPTFTVGLNNSYRFGHLFRTCAQFYNSLTVKSLASEESPSNPNFSAMDGLSSTPSGAAIGVVEPVEEDALGSVIMNLMGRLTRFRKLGLTVQDKVDFLDYFILRNNGIGSMKKISTQKATSTSALSSSRSSRSKRQ